VSAAKKVETWHLQMFRPGSVDFPPCRSGVAIVRAENWPVEDYLALYRIVGAIPLGWSERVKMPASELPGIIHDPRVEIYLLKLRGEIIGFAELDGRQPEEIELKYFGLVPEMTGLGMGPYLVRWVIAQVWNRPNPPKRFWVHTCEKDDPRAKSMYEKAGFIHYNTTMEDS
jgi:hypothetical protein